MDELPAPNRLLLMDELDEISLDEDDEDATNELDDEEEDAGEDCDEDEEPDPDRRKNRTGTAAAKGLTQGQINGPALLLKFSQCTPLGV